MYDNVKERIRCALAGALARVGHSACRARSARRVQWALVGASALGVLAGVANAQESEKAADIHNVLLTFHLVEADGFTDQDPEISDVVSELRKLFNFQGYRLLSTSVFNVGLVRDGSYLTGEGSQRIGQSQTEAPLTILADVSSRRSTGTVRAKVTLTDQPARVFGSIVEQFPLLEASVTIRDGQRVVLGSARRTADEPVLILIVTPRIDP